MKTCSRCKNNKPLTEFYAKKIGQVEGRCKTCFSEMNKENYEKNKHRAEYKERKKRNHKLWAERNPGAKAIYDVEYRLKNKHRINQREANKIKTCPAHKLKKTLRNRLLMAIKNKCKKGSAVRDLGCSIEELKTYLESKFQPGMSWENHSRTGWHIDHIVPLSHFDLENEDEFKKACHYTNLQPLWAVDNLRKSNKAA